MWHAGDVHAQFIANFFNDMGATVKIALGHACVPQRLETWILHGQKNRRELTSWFIQHEKRGRGDSVGTAYGTDGVHSIELKLESVRESRRGRCRHNSRHFYAPAKGKCQLSRYRMESECVVDDGEDTNKVKRLRAVLYLAQTLFLWPDYVSINIHTVTSRAFPIY